MLKCPRTEIISTSSEFDRMADDNCCINGISLSGFPYRRQHFGTEWLGSRFFYGVLGSINIICLSFGSSANRKKLKSCISILFNTIYKITLWCCGRTHIFWQYCNEHIMSKLVWNPRVTTSNRTLRGRWKKTHLLGVYSPWHGPGGGDVVHDPFTQALRHLVELQEVADAVDHLVVPIGVGVHLLEDGCHITKDGGVKKSWGNTEKGGV